MPELPARPPDCFFPIIAPKQAAALSVTPSECPARVRVRTQRAAAPASPPALREMLPCLHIPNARRPPWLPALTFATSEMLLLIEASAPASHRHPARCCSACIFPTCADRLGCPYSRLRRFLLQKPQKDVTQSSYASFSSWVLQPHPLYFVVIHKESSSILWRLTFLGIEDGTNFYFPCKCSPE